MRRTSAFGVALAAVTTCHPPAPPPERHDAAPNASATAAPSSRSSGAEPEASARVELVTQAGRAAGPLRGNKAYSFDQDGIWRLDLDSRETTHLVEQHGVRSVAYADGALYWLRVESYGGEVWTSGDDGGGAKRVARGPTSMQAVLVDERDVWVVGDCTRDGGLFHVAQAQLEPVSVPCQKTGGPAAIVNRVLFEPVGIGYPHAGSIPSMLAFDLKKRSAVPTELEHVVAMAPGGDAMLALSNDGDREGYAIIQWRPPAKPERLRVRSPDYDVDRLAATQTALYVETTFGHIYQVPLDGRIPRYLARIDYGLIAFEAHDDVLYWTATDGALYRLTTR